MNAPPAKSEDERLSDLMTDDHMAFLVLVHQKAFPDLAIVKISLRLDISRQEIYRMRPTLQKHGFDIAMKRAA